MERRLLTCECSSTEHIGIFEWFEEDKDNLVYLSIHLAKLPFWKRLVQGIKYIFGYRCKYGDFEEIILGKENIQSLKDVLNVLEKKES